MTIIKPPLPYRLRSMRLSDIPTVMTIEKEAFPVPWKASAYEYEIAHNRVASYQVLSTQLGDQPSEIIGYIGYWMLADEAHLSTIAVKPEWRRRGLGELLLLNMLFRCYEKPAEMATLEVRASNKKAQFLYQKYLFLIVGERRRYYQNSEDALIMTRAPLDEQYRIFLLKKKLALFNKLNGTKLSSAFLSKSS